MKLLIAETSKTVSGHIATVLEHNGFRVTCAHAPADAIDMLNSYAFDAVLVSDRFNEADPERFLRELQLHDIVCPVVILSRASDRPDGARQALEAGADEFIHPATPISETVARLRAVIRRSHRQNSNQLEFGSICIDLSSKCAWVGDEMLRLTKMEYDVLEVLAVRRGRTVSREMILDLVYGGADEPEAKIIDVYICKLRRKMSALGAPDLIQTVWGRGYMFVAAGVVPSTSRVPGQLMQEHRAVA